MSSSRKQAKLAREAKRDRAVASARGQSRHVEMAASEISASTPPKFLGDGEATARLLTAGVNNKAELIKRSRREQKALRKAHVGLDKKFQAIRQMRAVGEEAYQAFEASLVDFENEARRALASYADAIESLAPHVADAAASVSISSSAECTTLNLLLQVTHLLAHHFPGQIKYQESCVEIATRVLAVAVNLIHCNDVPDNLKDAISYQNWLAVSTKQALTVRGLALTHLKRYEEAIEDLSAAATTSLGELSTVIPIGPYPESGQDKKPNQSLSLLLVAMALQKQQMKAPRPHYTAFQAREIQKKFGLGDFSDECLRCDTCKAVPTARNGVSLKACSRCENARYCATGCQRQAWDSGHKKFCKPKAERRAKMLIGVVMVNQDVAELMKEWCQSKAYFVLEDSRLGPSVALQDETGEFYVSLTNNTVRSMDEIWQEFGEIPLNEAGTEATIRVAE